MKKIVALLLVLCVAFCLVACKKEETSSDFTSDVSQPEIIESQLDSSSEDGTSDETESEKTESKTESEKTNTDTVSKTESESKPTNTSSASKPTSSTQDSHTHTFSQATCTEPAKCSCGATQGAALGHKFIDNRCTVCKEAESGYNLAESSDKTFSILLSDDIYNKCKVQPCSDADGIEIVVKEALFGSYQGDARAFVFKSVYNDFCATFEEQWKTEEHVVIFNQNKPTTNEEMGYKLEKVITVGDFTIYCQYIDDRSKINGETDAINKILDKKAEIYKTLKFN